MFIWDIDKILDSIRNDRFSESDKLKYYIITSLFSLFIAFETFDLLSVSGIIKIILIMSITVIGAIYIYNKNHDGKNFIERTTIFAVPLSFRMILIGGVYGVIAGIVSEIVGCPDCIQSPYFSTITTFIFAIIAIYWEGCWFSRLSENEIKEIETNTD